LKIKRYLVNNMPEAMETIKRDLGSNAVLISSRWVKQGGFLSFLRPHKLEVIAAVEEKSPAVHDSTLSKDVAELKALLKSVSGLGKDNAGKNDLKEQSNLLLKWQNVLQVLELSHEVTNHLLQDIKDNRMLSQDENEKLLKETVENRLLQIFEDSLQERLEKKICVFVGSPGVGKTTTLAKIAANLALFEQKKIALLTIDTYRIGAVEQLKTYGEIMDVPMEAILTPAELTEAVKRHQDKDHILIDTAGRPSINTVQLDELKSFIDVLDKPEVFLVLSCTTKNKDLLRTAEAFKRLNYTKLIFTKADETISLGSIVNLVRTTSLPIAYITTGQNVPDDIEACDPEKLVQLILRAVG
jgi:flagellar biosynthesis protein FlhF